MIFICLSRRCVMQEYSLGGGSLAHKYLKIPVTVVTLSVKSKSQQSAIFCDSPAIILLLHVVDPKKGITGDLNFIGTDRALNTGIIERFCFLMLCRKTAAHAVNTDAPVRLRGFSGR